MKHSYSFGASTDFINELKSFHQPLGLFPEEEIHHYEDDDLFKSLVEELNRDSSLYELLLEYNYSSNRGDIRNIQICSGSLTTNGEGRIEIEYDVFYDYGCENINKEYEYNMNIEVHVDIETGVITLTGENKPERDPDEY